MALTEASIDRILEGIPALVEAIRMRTNAVTRLDDVDRLVTDTMADHWAGTRDAVDGPRLPFVFSRLMMDRQLASGHAPKFEALGVLGEQWPIDTEVPFTDDERAAVEARMRQVLQMSSILTIERMAIVRRFTPQAGPTWKELVARTTVIRPDDPEAREWLRNNPGAGPLAANVFDAAQARAFVDALYAAGARRVMIASERIREDPPYSDAIRIELPGEPARRAAVLALVNAEAEDEGFDPHQDTGQNVVYLWWD